MKITSITAHAMKTIDGRFVPYIRTRASNGWQFLGQSRGVGVCVSNEADALAIAKAEVKRRLQ